jgi:hypothetical protein
MDCYYAALYSDTEPVHFAAADERPRAPARWTAQDSRVGQETSNNWGEEA